MGGEELLYGSSTMAAALASAGEGWEEVSGKGIIAELGNSE